MTRPRYLRPEHRHPVPPELPAVDLPEPGAMDVEAGDPLEPRFLATVVGRGRPCPDCGERVIGPDDDRCVECTRRQERETSGDDAMFDRLGYGLEDDHE